MNQERWCSGDSSHGQARGFPRHRFYDNDEEEEDDEEYEEDEEEE